MRSSTRALGVLALLATLLWGKAAAALAQDEWLAGAQLAGTAVHGHTGGGFDPGAGALIELQRGLTDLWAARVAVGFDAFKVPTDRWRRDLSLDLGGAAAFDVLRVVPFIEVGLIFVLADIGAEGGTNTRVGVQAGCGVDYLVDRSWSVGAVLRGAATPLALAGPDVAGGVVLSASLRLGWRF